MAVAVRRYNTARMEEVQGFTGSHWTPPLGEYYVRLYELDMAMTFFYLFSSSNCRKRSRVNAKAPVFNRGITYQTKEKGLTKVSI